MCGIVGFFERAPATGRDAGESLLAMRDALRHRGPDDAGVFIDADGRLGLGHRRLSIVDLSPAGHQPMHSADGRHVIIFNGEIYNYQEIRAQLDADSEGIRWRGHSDTEVLLTAIGRWGIVTTLKRLVGMFAFALWDRQERRVHLVRDRLGEKPLYYGWSGQTFLFGSELKALASHPDWKGEIDRDALALFLRHNYIPAPHSIYRGIKKLPPGMILSLEVEKLTTGELPEPKEYWSVREALARGAATPFRGNAVEAVGELERILREAVGLQMVADVPLGAFLSGGVDSSAVVALMQAQSARPIRSFSIGFGERDYNEAQHAKRVAAHLGTDHTELYVSPAEALGVIPKLPKIYDEPFADSSQIPTYLVSQLARRYVTVSLSGDGGDEVFFGYPRYRQARHLWRMLRLLPAALRRAIAGGLRSVQPATWEHGLGWAARCIPGPSWDGRLGDRMHKLAALLGHSSPEALYLAMISSPTMDRLVPGARPQETRLEAAAREGLGHGAGFLNLMSYLDLMSYLPEDILVKTDRAAMAVSLESRMPLLDHRVVEFACTLPEALKERDGVGKWALRQVLHKYVPSELVERPKMGFGVPIDHWLRGPLREWGESLLNERRLQAEGILDPVPIRRMWAEHQAGTRRWHNHLWSILMFQAWREEWIGS